MIYTIFLWSTWKLQTSTFRLSRKKLQLISMAFAKFVVLGTNSSIHTITCFCYKYRKSRHSQLLHKCKVSSVFPYFLFKKAMLLSADVEGTDGGCPVYDIARHDSHADCFYHLSVNLSDGCHYTHLETGRNIRYDWICVQKCSDLADKYFQDRYTVTAQDNLL